MTTLAPPPSRPPPPSAPFSQPRPPGRAPMLTGTTPSTHDGRRNVFAGVDGGELTGEMVMSSGAEPERCDEDTSPSSREDLQPAETVPTGFLRLRLRWRCSQLPPPAPPPPRDFEPPTSVAADLLATRSGSLVHLSCSGGKNYKKLLEKLTIHGGGGCFGFFSCHLAELQHYPLINI